MKHGRNTRKHRKAEDSITTLRMGAPGYKSKAGEKLSMAG